MEKLPLGFGMICGGLFFVILFVGGLILILSYSRSKKKAGLSQQWPFIPGMITVSEVKQSASTDEDGYTTYSYFPHVEYSYTVNGQIFSGKQIAFGATRGYNSSQNAQAQLGKYPLNASIWVFYNPQNPSEAVLERAESSGNKTSLIIGIILMVLSILIACPLTIGLIRNLRV